MGKPFRKTIAVSIVHLALSLAATVVALQRELPANVFDHTSDKPVRQSFVPRGTALSAPPYMLATLALMTSLLAMRRRGRTPVAAAMITYGTLSLMGSLSEQIVRRVFRRSSFDPVLAAFILAVAGTSLLIVVFGSAELVGYRRLLRQAAKDESIDLAGVLVSPTSQPSPDPPV